MAELGAAIRRVAAGQPLGSLAPGNTKPIENPSHDAGWGTDGLFLKAFGNLLGGQIRPHNVRAHGITCGAVLDRLLHLVGQVRVFDFRLFASTSGLADATSGRIIGELRKFPHAVFDGLGIASQDLGDGAGAAMAECDRFECRKASAILCREALGVLTQELFDVWTVSLLKVKRHDGSSSSQMLQAMGAADCEVFTSRSNHASRNKAGHYFDAIPKEGVDMLIIKLQG